ncbi:MAG TPA: hypothetical protein PKY77_21910 [Phycisphaerae bacterium]|nr:hypothetical protein [Phycisphaerae bacterium]HRY69252.1 hypothetical protein [Phycisphaerae bacterium]HSA26570.1 hypothetical protein [Phycisphaerae bacterium]
MQVQGIAGEKKRHPSTGGDRTSFRESCPRLLPLKRTPDTVESLSPDLGLTEVICPFQGRLAGTANQMVTALLAVLILAIIVFPASFGGTWGTMLTKIMYWLY